MGRCAGVLLLVLGMLAPAARALNVEADFEGASVRVVEIDAGAQTVRFMPGGDPRRGWPCWWFFRVTGLDAARPLNLELHGSDAVLPQANGAPANKPLAAEWAMPERAAMSLDSGKTWRQTAPGRRDGPRMTYSIEPKGASLLVAWGPPFTPSRAAELVRSLARTTAHAQELELCRSAGGRSVPLLRVCEGDRTEAHRFGIWVQARQHAWESGASWVGAGFAEWLLGGEMEAQWMRQHAEVFIVPVMDVDNAATGNGGKEAIPHDHNRDWSARPHWNEVAAAQRMILELARAGRLDVFLDLHNPAPSDKLAFFFASPPDLPGAKAGANRGWFLRTATREIATVMPVLPAPRITGPGYHPLWQRISGVWVDHNGNDKTAALCLETPWNTERSTTDGYRAVGAALGRAVSEYLESRPLPGS